MIELLIVVAIMGLLTATIAFVSSVMIGRARVAKAQGDINRLITATKQLEIDTGRWPNGYDASLCYDEVTNTGGAILDNNAITGLTVPLVTGVVNTTATWKGPYIDQIPLDPWGNQYRLDPDYWCYPDRNKYCEQWENSLNASGYAEIVAIYSAGPNGSAPDTYDTDDVVLSLCSGD